MGNLTEVSIPIANKRADYQAISTFKKVIIVITSFVVGVLYLAVMKFAAGLLAFPSRYVPMVLLRFFPSDVADDSSSTQTVCSVVGLWSVQCSALSSTVRLCRSTTPTHSILFIRHKAASRGDRLVTPPSLTSPTRNHAPYFRSGRHYRPPAFVDVRASTRFAVPYRPSSVFPGRSRISCSSRDSISLVAVDWTYKNGQTDSRTEIER